ncbi:uncharacterized protein LOC122127081 [Dipodomys spectabilis]|uniref:uncharacterized protein LOC122127081 n=1 Tax=Dipodomys spectabilis TaxID=105255 RepID=UPI001C546D6F|nr:uncharacterized protein LOC122127081 [Dipodomys spectabilis]
MSALTELLPAATLRPSPRPPHRPDPSANAAPRAAPPRRKGDGLRPTSRPGGVPATPSPGIRVPFSFSEQHLLTKHFRGWTGRAGDGGGLWMRRGRGSRRRKPLGPEKHREPEGDRGKKVMEERQLRGREPHAPPNSVPPSSSLGVEADLARTSWPANRSWGSAVTLSPKFCALFLAGARPPSRRLSRDARGGRLALGVPPRWKRRPWVPMREGGGGNGIPPTGPGARRLSRHSRPRPGVRREWPEVNDGMPLVGAEPGETRYSDNVLTDLKGTHNIQEDPQRTTSKKPNMDSPNINKLRYKKTNGTLLLCINRQI